MISDSGAIQTNGTLDREAIVAKYGVDRVTYTVNYDVDSRKNSFGITIVVDDINDNTPQFDGLPPSINVGSNVQGQIWPLSATDPDRGNNGTVRYRIVRGNEEEYFAITHLEGDVSRMRLSLTTFPPTGRTFTLILEAEDQGSEVQLANQTSFQINITDAANDAPVFAQSNYVFRVPISAEVGRSVGLVSAMDPDSNANSSIIYYFDSSDPSYVETSMYFEISRSSGIIKLLSVPRLARISFLVFARNNLSVSGVELVSSVPVFVNFYRGNDIPQILLANLDPIPSVVHLTENQPFFELDRMSITDNDEITNASASLSPNVGHIFSFETLGPFRILTLNITVPIDREKIPMVNITLSATDVDGGNGSVTLQIVIDDENDNHPIFDNNGQYSNVIPETTPVGTTIVKVNATDPDLGPNGTVRYTLVSSSPPQAEERLSLNRTTGEIVVTRLLDYENEALRHITFLVNASDLGPRSNATTATVTIDVQDVDEPPAFSPDAPTEIDVLYNVTTPSVLHTYGAVDDSVDGQVQYSLNCTFEQDSFLRINPNGELVLLSIPPSLPSVTECTIHSSDNGGQSSRLEISLFYIQNECGSNPCRNNASCLNTRSGYHCNCPLLYGGDQCDLPLNPCEIYSCENYGLCIGEPLSHNYKCNCREGYGGRRCEVQPISFSRKGFAVYPSFKENDQLTSLSLEVLTRDSYGLLFYKPYSAQEFVSLEIVENRVVFKDTRKSSAVQLESRSILIKNGIWYSISVNYTLLEPKLEVKRVESHKTTHSVSTSPLDNQSYQVLGGVRNIATVPLSQLSAYDFVGCIGNVVVNNKLVVLSTPEDHYGWQLGCDSATSSPLSMSQCVVCDNVPASLCSYIRSRVSSSCMQDSLLKSFSGRGFVQFRFTNEFFFFANILQQGAEAVSPVVKREVVISSVFEISVNFLTSTPGEIVFAISNNQSYHILIVTSTQLVYLISHEGEAEAETFTLDGNYYDNKWHKATVRISASTNNVHLLTEQESVIKLVRSQVELSLSSATTKLYIGGVPSDLSNVFSVSPNKEGITAAPFSGCVNNLTLNNFRISLDTPIEDMVEQFAPLGTFSQDASSACSPPSTGPLTTDPSLYLVVAVPAGGVVLLIILIVTVTVILCCCHYRCFRHKGTFNVGSLGSFGQSGVMQYHSEAGEFHPDEDEDTDKRYHIRQTSIDSPTVNSIRHHIPNSVSQETGFHEPPIVLGGSSTDIKSDYSDADESTQPHSDDENRRRTTARGHQQKRQRVRVRRGDMRKRHDSLTSTEERVMNPLRLRDSEIRTPSLEGGLDVDNSLLGTHPRPKVPSPITPLHFQEDSLRSLSAPRVTPNHYWEEASRMKPAVDTEDHNLRLSQLITEQMWVMEPPSSSTSVVSSAVEDHHHLHHHPHGVYRPTEFHSQGGVEEEANIDNLSHLTEDSVNHRGRGYKHRQPFGGPSQRPPWSLPRQPQYQYQPPPRLPGNPLGPNSPGVHLQQKYSSASTSQPHSPRRTAVGLKDFATVLSPHRGGSPRSPKSPHDVHNPRIIRDGDIPPVPSAGHIPHDLHKPYNPGDPRDTLSPQNLHGPHTPRDFHSPNNLRDIHSPGNPNDIRGLDNHRDIHSPRGIHCPDSPHSPRGIPSPHSPRGIPSPHSPRGIPSPVNRRGNFVTSTPRESPKDLSFIGLSGDYHTPGESPTPHSPTTTNPRATPTKDRSPHHVSPVCPSPIAYKNQYAKAESPKVTLSHLASRGRNGPHLDPAHYSLENHHYPASQPIPEVGGPVEGGLYHHSQPYHTRQSSLEARLGNYCNGSAPHQPTVDV
jgi:hypothetical protein